MIICKQCGIRRKKTRIGQEFCSIKCSAESKIYKPRQFRCEYCRETYVPTRVDSQYCTDSCRKMCHANIEKDRIYIFKLGDLYRLRLINRDDLGELKGMIVCDNAGEIIEQYGTDWQEIDRTLISSLF